MLKLKRRETPTKFHTEFEFRKTSTGSVNKLVGIWGFQLLYGETYNIHLDLLVGEISYSKVVRACREVCRMMSAKTIVAWIPVENTGACRGIVQAGFTRMGSTPELNFYTLEN